MKHVKLSIFIPLILIFAWFLYVKVNGPIWPRPMFNKGEVVNTGYPDSGINWDKDGTGTIISFSGSWFGMFETQVIHVVDKKSRIVKRIHAFTKDNASDKMFYKEY